MINYNTLARLTLEPRKYVANSDNFCNNNKKANYANAMSFLSMNVLPLNMF